MVGVDDHLLLHHPADQVLAELGEAAGVAVRAGAVERGAPGGSSALSTLPASCVAVGRRRRVGCALSWLWASGAGPICQKRPVSIRLPALTTTPVVPAVAGHAAERVVELVDQLHVADAELVDLVELLVDLGLGALRLVVLDAAVEQLGDLDPEHDGELALVDHAARLERVGDDPEPALARAAVLGVDVVLQLADALAPAAGRRPSRCTSSSCTGRSCRAPRCPRAGSRTRAGRRARSARATCSSVCSWVSEAWCGQSLSVGQPRVSWVPSGLP